MLPNHPDKHRFASIVDPAELLAYWRSGALTVEAEAAALFAVGAYRGIEVGAAFAVSDSLAEGVWKPGFDSAPIRGGLERVLEAAIAVMTG